MHGNSNLKFLVLISVRDFVHPRASERPEGLFQWHSGNRTRSFPVCSSVPQATAKQFRPDKFWEPVSLDLLPQCLKGQDVKPIIHPHLMSRLRMREAISSFSPAVCLHGVLRRTRRIINNNCDESQNNGKRKEIRFVE